MPRLYGRYRITTRTRGDLWRLASRVYCLHGYSVQALEHQRVVPEVDYTAQAFPCFTHALIGSSFVVLVD